LARTEELRAPKILPFSFRLGNTPKYQIIKTSKQGSPYFYSSKKKKEKRKKGSLISVNP
jgi:hypothetical protein